MSRISFKQLLGCIVPLLVLACDPTGLGRANPDFYVIGHRGAPKLVAENTIRSFRVATALGANAMETDVCRTQDGHFVLWHDYDPDGAIAVARQAGVEGLGFIPLVPKIGSEWRRPVDQLTLEELRTHYGYGNIWGLKEETATIPTLAESFVWITEEAGMRALYLDVKLPEGSVDSVRDLVGEVSAAIEATPALAEVQFYMLSVHRDLVDAMEAERVRLGPKNMRTVWDYEELGALDGTLKAGLRDVSTGLVPSITWARFKREAADLVDAREAGKLDSITVWTFDGEDKLTELLYYSVDGVMTNEPGVLYQIWQSTLQ